MPTTFLILCAITMAMACVPAQLRHAGNLEDLARLARRKNDNPEIQRALALGEMYHPGGNMDRAQQAIAQAIQSTPNDPTLQYTQARWLDLRGSTAEAVHAYLKLLKSLGTHPNQEHYDLAAAALFHLHALAPLEPKFRDRTFEALQELLKHPRGLGPVAFMHVGDIVLQEWRQRGDPEKVRSTAMTLGCARTWTAYGPFGNHTLADFNRTWPVDQQGLNEPIYDPGNGLPLQRPQEFLSLDGKLSLPKPPGQAGGTAVFVASLPHTEPLLFRVTSDSYVRIEQSEHLFSQGVRTRQQPIESWVPHTPNTEPLRVRFSARYSGSSMGFCALPASLFDAPMHSFGSSRANQWEQAFQHSLRASILLHQGKPIEALSLLATPRTDGGFELPENATPDTLDLFAQASVTDPHATYAQRRQRSNHALSLWAVRDRSSWRPQYRKIHALLEDAEHETALNQVNRALQKFPTVFALLHTKAKAWSYNGRPSPSVRLLKNLARTYPTHCVLWQQLGHALEQVDGNYDQIKFAHDQYAQCDASSFESLFSAIKSGQSQWANTEVTRLDALGLIRGTTLESYRQQLALMEGDTELADLHLEAFVVQHPLYPNLWSTWLDRHFADSSLNPALLNTAVEHAPMASAAIAIAHARVDPSTNLLTPFRRSGEAFVTTHRATLDEATDPSVLALDYTLFYVFEDGASIEVTHNIWKLNSKEALDARGEFDPPPGAEILTLRTWKSDGSTRTPDHPQQGGTYSFAGLTEGDLIEYEYAVHHPPVAGLAGVFQSPQFFFQNPETPFLESMFRAVVPADWSEDGTLQVESRNGAPVATQELRGEHHSYTWTAQDTEPLPAQEPNGVRYTEYVPHVWVGHQAQPDSAASIYQLQYDGVFDPDPRATALAESIVNASDKPPAQALYEWAVKHVEGIGSGSAATRLFTGKGPPVVVLHYLCSLLGIPSKLVHANSVVGDPHNARLQTRTPMVLQSFAENALWVEGHGVLFPQKHVPFGHTPAQYRGQLAYNLEDPTTQRIVQSTNRTTVQHHIDVELTDQGTNAKVSETWFGDAANEWREVFSQLPPLLKEQWVIRGYLTPQLPGAQIEQLTVPHKSAVNASQTDPELTYLATSNEALSPWDWFPTQLVRRFAALPSRFTTEIVAIPIHQVLEVHGPQELFEGHVTPREILGPNGATATLTVQRKAGTTHIRREIHIPSMRTPPNEYAIFARFCQQADNLWN